MTAKFVNSFEFEQPLWQAGVTRVAGVKFKSGFKSGFAFLPPENYGSNV